MARHSNKHKKSKHKKNTNAIHSSSSSKSRSKKVSFEGTSSGVETIDSGNKTTRHHSTKSHTSRFQDLKNSSSKQHSTGETSKHRQRPIPSIKSSGSSCTIQSPVSQKAGARDQPREKEVHPYAASFSGLFETLLYYYSLSLTLTLGRGHSPQDRAPPHDAFCATNGHLLRHPRMYPTG